MSERIIIRCGDITKQKSDKQKKKIMNKNADRAKKLGIIYIPKNQ